MEVHFAFILSLPCVRRAGAYFPWSFVSIPSQFLEFHFFQRRVATFKRRTCSAGKIFILRRVILLRRIQFSPYLFTKQFFCLLRVPFVHIFPYFCVLFEVFFFWIFDYSVVVAFSSCKHLEHTHPPPVPPGCRILAPGRENVPSLIKLGAKWSPARTTSPLAISLSSYSAPYW